MNPGAAGQRSAIETALLDYHRSPGRYALIRRQPEVLFGSVKEVLQLASGRSPEGSAAQPPAAAVRRAAAFFIRSALLYPGADHYELLGLDSSADAAAVKDRYRLMMRLMHPDFAATVAGGGWPPDAAARLNQAYEVLSSPARRRSYDEQRNAPAAASQPRKPDVRAVRVFEPAANQVVHEDKRRRLKRLAAVFGSIGGLALLATLYAGISGEKESLVQRASNGTSKAKSILAALAEEGKAATTPAPIPQSPPVMAADSAPPPAERRPPPVPAIVAAVQPPPPVAAIALASPPLASNETPGRAPAKTMEEAAEPAAIASEPPVAAPVQPPVAVAAVAPPAAPVAPPAAAAAKPPPNAGVTLAEVHPLMSKLLQQMESGSADRIIDLLDREARDAPSAQAFMRHYDSLVAGGRPIKLSHVQLKAEPREGRLVVTGQVLVHSGEQSPGASGKRLAVQAEFVSRQGTVVMTRLARAQDN